MAGSDADEPEVLEGGHEPPGGRRALDGVAGGHWTGVATRLTPRGRCVAGVVSLVLVVAAVGGYEWLRNRPARVPPVGVSADRVTPSVPLWSAGADGRPVAPVTLSVSALLTDPDRRAGTPAVVPVGLTGPGLTASGAFPALTLGRAPASIELTGQVSCDRVPIPVPGDAYAVRLHVVDGPRSAYATAPLGRAAPDLVQRVTVGCATWLAARDLTVTGVRAAVDPREPRADLVLDIHNAGARPALVWTAPGAGGITVSDVREAVAPHATVAVPVSVRMLSCWSWPGPGTPTTTADTPVGLLGAVGVDRPLSLDALPAMQGDNGVVLAPAAAEQLRAALVQACAGIDSPVLLSSPGRASYDARTDVLTAHVVVDLPAGLVNEVRFLPPAAGDTALHPLFTATPWLQPDSNGQAGYTLRYTVPADVPCLGGGPFVALDMLARVPTPGGEREVRFQLAAEILLPEAQIQAACHGNP